MITKYDVTRLDMDIEGSSLTKAAGIDRRNKALKIVQKWATSPQSAGEYTLPTSPHRARGRRIAVLQNASQRHARRRRQHHDLRLLRRVTRDMGTAAISAAKGSSLSCTRSTRRRRPRSSTRWSG